MGREYQMCTRCVMDTSDAEISFDSEGVCNHCHQFDNVTSKRWYPNEEGARTLAEKLDEIRKAGEGKQYDCILGLSGGVDSSYLALKIKEWGLRPLVIHVDAGWNSELASSNIETLVKHCDFDLHTIVIDWEDMRELQLSYLKSGLANQDVPQDHAFFANLYYYATKNKIKYILNGGNIATEAVEPMPNQGSAMDATNLKAVQKRFGTNKLADYRTISFFEYYILFPFVYGMKQVRPLNFLPYNKEEAVKALTEIGWRSYGRKHGESRFTKLFQNYYLPEKFGLDKRRAHLSSLVLSGQMTRREALTVLDQPLYDPSELAADLAFFCKKMRISEADFRSYMAVPNRNYAELPNWDSKLQLGKRLQQLVGRLTGRYVNTYS